MPIVTACRFGDHLNGQRFRATGIARLNVPSYHLRPCKCTIVMSSTPSSRRRTTWCFLCIESDGIVGKFSARQHACPRIVFGTDFTDGRLMVATRKGGYIRASGSTAPIGDGLRYLSVQQTPPVTD
jgi:hypothetical protein